LNTLLKLFAIDHLSGWFVEDLQQHLNLHGLIWFFESDLYWWIANKLWKNVSRFNYFFIHSLDSPNMTGTPHAIYPKKYASPNITHSKMSTKFTMEVERHADGNFLSLMKSSIKNDYSSLINKIGFSDHEPNNFRLLFFYLYLA
jgi:hypothetical protein